MRNKKTAVERPAVKYLKYELAQRPIIDKLQLHYQKYGCGVVLSFGVQWKSLGISNLRREVSTVDQDTIDWEYLAYFGPKFFF